MDANRRKFWEAVKQGDAQELKRRLSADGGLVRETDESGKTALHWAAEKNECEIAGILLDAGAEIEAESSWGATALDWAATLGSTRVADLLLERGAQGLNLASAASLGKLEVVRALLAPGGALEPRRGVPREPNEHWREDTACLQGDAISDAFYGACRNGHTEVAAVLLENGASVNAKGVFGGTGLHWAAINGHKGTVEFLLRNGADARMRDGKFDATAEEWAAEGGQEENVRLLRGGSEKRG